MRSVPISQGFTPVDKQTLCIPTAIQGTPAFLAPSIAEMSHLYSGLPTVKL